MTRRFHVARENQVCLSTLLEAYHHQFFSGEISEDGGVMLATRAPLYRSSRVGLMAGGVIHVVLHDTAECLYRRHDQGKSRDKKR